jgi:DNA-binding winged helix-turn-helix (wHTH) protein/tetratricopeptide (TPR) repeat protein
VRKSPVITFPPFQLDAENQRLWRDDQLITLSPKPFAVLLYLLQRQGQLVSKGELLDACWPDTTVTDTVLKVCVRQIREALADDARSPKFIETSHRRGYCFIGRVTDGADATSESLEVDESAPSLRRAVSEKSPMMVGRNAELSLMGELFERAQKGERQVIFVVGEAGIGKTALIETFLTGVDSGSETLIARGQCLEQYGATEAYLPVMEAISRLCRESTSPTLVERLFRLAPTWVAQLPALVSAGDLAALRRETLGATRDRMVREMAETLESLAANTPVLLILEDLHWSDYSTVDLISALARRRETARLMLIGTYRPVDLILREHPLKALKQELQVHRQCEELALEYLSEGAITDYLAERFPANQFPAGLARVIHRRTEGNPLFMVNVVDFFSAQGFIVRSDEWKLGVRLEELDVGMPDNIRQMIEKHIERMSREDQQVLEAASICGMKFSALAVASALGTDVIDVEERCEALARQSCFLQARGSGEFPDGTVSARYGFIHSLYLNALSERIPAARSSRLHLRMAERGEIIYRDRVGEIASELAMHFEQGRDYRKAIKYLGQSADIDSRRYAGREAIENLEHALKLVRRLPESEQQAARMIVLEQRGMVRRAMGDMTSAAADFMELASLAKECDQVETEAKALLHAASAFSWVERRRCPETFERAVALIPRLQGELMKTHVRAYWGYWYSRFLMWRDEDEQACEKAIEATRQAGDRALLSMHVARQTYYLCLRSDYESACRVAEEGSWLTLEAGDGFDYLYCLFYWAWALLHAGQLGKLRAVLRTAIDVAEKNGQNLLAALLSLESAWLYEQALDFNQARDLCERILMQTSAAQHETGNLLGLILQGTADVGLGRHDRALECFNRVAGRLERDQVLIEWILRLPMQYGLSQSLLGQGELTRARQEAETLCELASLPGERTYVALGRKTLAEIALAEGELAKAEEEIEQALGALNGSDIPLAEWRVHATAAAVYAKAGQAAEAAQHWTKRSDVLRKLADSLDESDDLRVSLLSAANQGFS